MRTTTLTAARCFTAAGRAMLRPATTTTTATTTITTTAITRSLSTAHDQDPFVIQHQQKKAQAAANALLTERRTLGKLYDGRPVPLEVLMRAVDAATYAPNHKLTEPWRFVSLGPESAAGLGRLVEEHIGGDKGAKKRESWAGVPTWLVALCRGQTVGPAHTENATTGDEALTSMDLRQLEDYAATACAVHNCCLSLHAAGVGSKWSTGGVTRKQSFRRLVGAAEDELVVGVLMCGYREVDAPPVKPPRKRRPLLALGQQHQEEEEEEEEAGMGMQQEGQEGEGQTSEAEERRRKRRELDGIPVFSALP
jgi:nitroreductase